MAAHVHYPQSALIGPGTGTQAAQISIQAIANTKVHNVVVDTCSQHSSSVTSLLSQLPTSTTFVLSFFRKGTVAIGPTGLSTWYGRLSILFMWNQYTASHKKSFQLKTSTCSQGWNPQKPTKQGRNNTTILLHHPYILCHFGKYYLCAQKGCLGHGKLCNEQYWVCSACCCVWRVGCVVAGSKLCCNRAWQAWLAIV